LRIEQAVETVQERATDLVQSASDQTVEGLALAVPAEQQRSAS
jgi:hypothetical protein